MVYFYFVWHPQLLLSLCCGENYHITIYYQEVLFCCIICIFEYPNLSFCGFQLIWDLNLATFDLWPVAEGLVLMLLSDMIGKWKKKKKQGSGGREVSFMTWDRQMHQLQ